ncbi:MAG: hypothetical protein WD607_11640 [Candidatus Paceibacterota bacterium]
MKHSEYFIKARLFPTILTSIPILCLYYFAIGKDLESFITFLSEIKWIGNVTISAAIVFAFVQINRFTSKELFQRFYFKDEIEMPTTKYLLIDNSFFASHIKDKIRLKIASDFEIQLLDEHAEKDNPIEAKKVIVSAVSRIRNSTRNNKMILQHNIEYGFVRNLIGGSLIAVIISSINLFVFSKLIQTPLAFKISLATLVLYIFPILLSKFVITKYGHYYAKTLFEQYLNS